MKSVCVYLGAKFGNSALFQDVVAQLGAQIALRNMRLVYGGSSLGLMGCLPQAHLSKGVRSPE